MINRESICEKCLKKDGCQTYKELKEVTETYLVDACEKYIKDVNIVVDEGKLALLEKTYADFCECESGEGWLKIDGKEYSTDVGYALEGMSIFMEVFKQRLAESEE